MPTFIKHFLKNGFTHPPHSNHVIASKWQNISYRVSPLKSKSGKTIKSRTNECAQVSNRPVENCPPPRTLVVPLWNLLRSNVDAFFVFWRGVATTRDAAFTTCTPLGPAPAPDNPRNPDRYTGCSHVFSVRFVTLAKFRENVELTEGSFIVTFFRKNRFENAARLFKWFLGVWDDFYAEQRYDWS